MSSGDSTQTQSEPLSLSDAAERLGVHYMTAYRYVRTGRLIATKTAGMWWVAPEDLQALDVARLRQPASPKDTSGRDFDQLAKRFQARLEVGDEGGAWGVINEALSHGVTPRDVHLKMITPAMAAIGHSWSEGETSIAVEHQASATLTRILGRMWSLFRRPGRRSATVVMGMVEGDQHSLSSAILADLICDAGFNSRDLGANVPAASFVEVAEQVDGPAAIVVSCAWDACVEALQSSAAEIRLALPAVPLIATGAAFASFPPGLQVDAIAESATHTAELLVAEFSRPVQVK